MTWPARNLGSLTVLLGFLVSSIPLHAQTPRSAVRDPLERPVVVMRQPSELQRAEEIRQQFQEVLRSYPPALGQVLRLDPGLMTNAAYLAPYPGISEYIRLHPEIVKHPDFYLPRAQGSLYQGPSNPETEMRQAAIRMWNDALEMSLAFAGFAAAIATLLWIVKLFIGHRRWLRATKMQAETNARLMERMASSDDLRAYIQSPLGAQLLKGTQPETAPEPMPATAPFGRILWSVQAGVVLVMAGIGLLFVKRYAIDEVALMIVTIGVLAASVGAGFIMAAFASYALSKRLGLFERT